MKEFFKMVFATIVGMILFGLIMGIFAVMCLVGMVASGSNVKSVEDNSVMVLNLNGNLEERSSDNFLNSFLGVQADELGLDNILDAIKKAKDNEDIKGIYIESGSFGFDSYASMQAIRRALVDFKKSGKWIIAYGDNYSQGTYYLASVADKIYINPEGMVDWHGIASNPMFFKDMMAKFGIKMQLAKVGTYKSAPEMFTADRMSDANREQVTAYINGIWENVVKDVSASRKISVDTLNAYADNLITFSDTKTLLNKKLVDGIMYSNEVKDVVKKQLKIDTDKDIHQLSLADMANVKDNNDSGEQIAVYYAFGDIVDGGTLGGVSQEAVIDSKKVCKDLASLTKDDNVKAVVLRINSGGGSAYASEQIWHQIELLKKEKPVVVSMGGMAASGGYYISCNSNWIVAEPTTLTGSIGIFGMFPDASGLLKDKLGIKFDEVKTNRNSAFGTMSRPINDEEMSYLNAYIDRGYKLFRQRVADGRKLSVDAVEAIAQGRVWLGQDAFKHKLVDQLGSLDDAIAKAAKLAKLDKYYTSKYPDMPDMFDQLLASSEESKGNYLDEAMQATLGDLYEPFLMLRYINNQAPIQARLPFVLNVR